MGQRHRTIVLGNAFKALPSEVQPVKLRIVLLQRSHDAYRLGIVVKAAIGFHFRIKRTLARVAKWRVPEVMGQRHGFDQFLIEPQSPSDCSRHLRHFDRMSQTRAEIITLMFNEDLCLMFEPPKGAGMNDPIPISLETGSKVASRLFKQSAAAVMRVGCETCCHDCPSCRLLLQRLYESHPIMSCELL